MEKFIILSKMAENNLFEKCVFEQIECSGLFLLDHNGHTRVYRLVSGPPDVWVRRKHDFPMEEDDCPPPLLASKF